MLKHPANAARHDYGVITVVGFAHGTSHFFHLLLPALYPWLMPEFELSFSRIGVTMTAFFVVSGIGQVVAGFAVDRFGARRVLMGGVGLLALAAAVLSFGARGSGKCGGPAG